MPKCGKIRFPAVMPFGGFAAEFARRCAADPVPRTAAREPIPHTPGPFHGYILERWGCLAAGVRS